MNELDQLWSEKLSTAIDNARKTGRGDLADYLELKAANDVVRQAGVEEFFAVVSEIAMAPEHASKSITVERESPHNFQHRGANMVGTLLLIRYGVRCMTVEAGWTRTPTDGFMRLGALAFARITHFGLPKANEEFVLKSTEGNAAWAAVKNDKVDAAFKLDRLREHFIVLVG